MKPLITWGLRLRRTALIWWSVGVASFITIEMAFYPSLHKNAAELAKTLNQLPASVKNLVGGSDYTSPAGYLNGRVFYLVLPMLVGILSINLAASLMSREEDSGTAEVILSRPVSRSRLYVSKALLGWLFLTIVTAIGGLFVILLAKVVKLDMPQSYILWSLLGAWLFASCTGAFTYMLSTFSHRTASLAAGVGAGFALGGYIVASLVPNFAWLKIPARCFAFYYYRPDELLHGSLTVWPLCVLALATIGFGFIGWLGFRQRDLRG